jgi:hypothetical protein
MLLSASEGVTASLQILLGGSFNLNKKFGREYSWDKFDKGKDKWPAPHRTRTYTARALHRYYI